MVTESKQQIRYAIDRKSKPGKDYPLQLLSLFGVFNTRQPMIGIGKRMSKHRLAEMHKLLGPEEINVGERGLERGRSCRTCLI